MGGLLAALCWAAVTLNCEGGVEEEVRYRHEVAAIYVVGTQLCGYDEVDEPINGCPVYASTDWGLTAFGPEPCLPQDPPDPTPGGVVLMKVTAVDKADNVDCGL